MLLPDISTSLYLILENGGYIMRTVRKLFALMIAAALIFSLAACGTENENKGGETTTAPEKTVYKTRIDAVASPVGIDLLHLKNNRSFAYDVKYCSDLNEIVSDMTSGKADIAAVPLNTAAKIYNETNGKIRILAADTYGFISLLSKDDSVKGFGDLKGKKIYASGQGEYGEYMLKYVLSKSGIDPDNDVKINYVSSSEELEKLDEDIYVLPEPYATTKKASDESLKRVINIPAAYLKITEEKPVQGCIIASTDYINSHPDELNDFTEYAEISLNFMKNSVSSAKLFLESGFYTDNDIIKESVTLCNWKFITGEEMKKSASSTFNALYEVSPEALGGKIPSDDIYYAG